jgi:hypothetical protein
MSFVDPTFTMGVSPIVTIAMAIDALSHAVERYMSNIRPSRLTVWAEAAMHCIGPYLTELGSDVCVNISRYCYCSEQRYDSHLWNGISATYYKGFAHGGAMGCLFLHTWLS